MIITASATTGALTVRASCHMTSDQEAGPITVSVNRYPWPVSLCLEVGEIPGLTQALTEVRRDLARQLHEMGWGHRRIGQALGVAHKQSQRWTRPDRP